MNHEGFMKQALAQAQAAFSDGEFPVGCILVHQDRVVVTGRRTGTAGERVNEVDHAEMVALRRLAEMKTRFAPGSITLFSTLEPCLMCYGATILSGIRTIVYALEDVMGGGTGCDLSTLNPLYRHAEVSVVPHILRSESAALLKAYYQNPENAYWKNSLLAHHVLAL